MSLQANLLNFALIFISIVFYIIPGIIASNRNHNNQLPIFILNVLLGWTVFGWIVALIWSFTDNVQKFDE